MKEITIDTNKLIVFDKDDFKSDLTWGLFAVTVGADKGCECISMMLKKGSIIEVE